MIELETTPGRTCICNDKEFLFFSGYSYLGMNKVAEFNNLVKEGIDKYGLLFPSSRISNSRLKLYENLENDLSEFTGMQETVSFSSGFLAGKTIASILSVYKNVYVAPGTHPAIKLAEPEEEVRETFTEWCKQITDIINSSSENEFVLALDSINIFTSEINELSFLNNINLNKKLIVLIDDSHGIGLTGKNGRGVTARLPGLNNIEFIISYSLSKALNIHGGAVSSSKSFAEKLRQHPNYTGSTAINPSLAYAYLHGKHLYAFQREKLFENIFYLRNKKISSGILKNDPGLSVFICNKENAEEVFFKNNIVISSFRYPYPASPKINRIIVNALHTPNDLDQLSATLNCLA